MKLWVDAVRPAPNEQEYAWMRSVDMAEYALILNERKGCPYEGIDLGHVDGGFGAENGKVLLEWLELTKREYPVQIHAADPFEKEVLNDFVRKNGWDRLMNYTVGFAVEGRAYVDGVRACSPAEAAEKAASEFCDVDLGELECVDFKAVIAYDEDDGIYDDYDVVNGSWFQAGAEQDYTVGFAVDCRAYVTEKGRCPAEAVRKAQSDFCEVALGSLETVSWKVVHAEDARGKLYDNERDLFGPIEKSVDDFIANAKQKCSEMNKNDNARNIEGYERG